MNDIQHPFQWEDFCEEWTSILLRTAQGVIFVWIQKFRNAKFIPLWEQLSTRIEKCGEYLPMFCDVKCLKTSANHVYKREEMLLGPAVIDS